MQTRRIRLHSERHFGKRLPRRAGRMIDSIADLTPRVVAMAFRRRSAGNKPSWLTPALDVRFVGHDGQDETNLYFEVPTFGEAAPQEYRQVEMWPSRPDEDDTGFELFADLLRDLAKVNRDSDLFDRSLLKHLLELHTLFTPTLFQSMEVESRRQEASAAATLDTRTLATVQTFYQSTPTPRRVKVFGTLDMIRASTQRFGLILPSGEEAPGVLTEGDVCNFQGLLNKPIVVFGRAVYRPSGKLLRIDADKIDAGTDADKFFGKVPSGSRPLSERRKGNVRLEKGGVEAIFGRWPGDETDEQIEEALKRLS